MITKTEGLIKKVVKKFDELKRTQVLKKEEYGSSFISVIGEFHWNNPDLLFVFTTNNEEDYEGSQTQVGISRDGKLYWEYQSHCSCDDYEDSKGLEKEFPPKDEKHSYELEGIPLDWEERIQKNIKLLLANG